VVSNFAKSDPHMSKLYVRVKGAAAAACAEAATSAMAMAWGRTRAASRTNILGVCIVMAR
jgi:hypothetical protein